MNDEGNRLASETSDHRALEPASELPSDVEALQKAVRARDRAAAVVAHDLRNPIAVISQTAEVLLHMLADPKARRQVERIVEVAKRARGLVDDLLDVAAIEAGTLSLVKRRVELSRIVLAAVETQHAALSRASIVTAIDLSPVLRRVEADEQRIHEVLGNLFDNAAKFTSAGGSITVGASMQGEDVLVWVKDSGSGIAEEHVPHLFDRFWQAGRTDRRGTGLGLTICKAIVEAHGGRIWVETAVGRGTTVFFTLPAAPHRSDTVSAAPANILLVDDKPENLVALEAILDRPGYRFLAARSGEEALRIALREPLSVALIDVVMPDMNGLEVAAHLKSLERCRDVPILFITALGNDPQAIRRAYEAGCADYLVKPLDPEIVRKKVAVFVNLSSGRNLGD